MTVPTLTEINAAWISLPVETRDRIGLIAVDMVFNQFMHGDLYMVGGQPEDRPVFDETIQSAAAETAHRRLNELSPAVWDALPDLFGRDGENPSWSENAGPVATPAALAAVAREAAEQADHLRRERSLRVRLGRKSMRLWREHGGYVVTDRGSEIPKTDILDLAGVEVWLVGQAKRKGADCGERE